MEVKLWNKLKIDDEFVPYEKKVEDVVYKWGPNSFLKMPRATAKKICQQGTPIRKDGPEAGQGHETLRLEENHEALAEKYGQPLKFVASDGSKFRSKLGMQEYEDSHVPAETGQKGRKPR